MSDNKPTKTPQKEALARFAERAKVKIGEMASRALSAEKTTQKVQRALKETEMQAVEVSALLRSQNTEVVQRTGVAHRAGVDATGMAVAIAVDLAAFEVLAYAAEKMPTTVGTRQKYLSGTPHLLLGLPIYAMSLNHRAKHPGFPPMIAEVGEEASKHLIVNGVTNIAKQYLSAR